MDKNHDNNNGVSQRLKSGEIVKRMKDRPLPPPPRPKREHKKHKKDDGDDEDKFDKDDGAERFAQPLTVETNILDEQVQVEAEAFLKCALPRRDSDFSETEKVIEVEVSTQTDPVLDEDFVCDEDEEDIDIDEFLSSDGKMKTLEDILKEEQEAELERARQLAEAENLSRGIQRFRDSSQRSMSERSGRASTAGDRSRSLSRPITPSGKTFDVHSFVQLTFLSFQLSSLSRRSRRQSFSTAKSKSSPKPVCSFIQSPTTTTEDQPATKSI